MGHRRAGGGKFGQHIGFETGPFRMGPPGDDHRRVLQLDPNRRTTRPSRPDTAQYLATQPVTAKLRRGAGEFIVMIRDARRNRQ